MGATMIRATSRERSGLRDHCHAGGWSWMGTAGADVHSYSTLPRLCGSLGGDMILGNR